MSASITDPGSLPILERRIGAYADSTQQQAGRIRVTIGQVVVAQLLPGALVKGGSGMKLRLGLDFARLRPRPRPASRRDRTRCAEETRPSAISSPHGAHTGSH